MFLRIFVFVSTLFKSSQLSHKIPKNEVDYTDKLGHLVLNIKIFLSSVFALKCYASEIVSVPASDTHVSNLKGRVVKANLRNSLGRVKVSFK